MLEEALGSDPIAYARSRLFDPLGMTDTTMAADPAGNAMTPFGIKSTCRDVARFGNLLLAGGQWDGQQIVPADYLEEATTPSTDLAANYGYLFWLNRRGRIASPLAATTGQLGGDIEDGQQVPGAPEDMYWALGFGKQILSVDPASKTVVVRLAGHVPRDMSPFTEADAADVVTEAMTD